MRFPVGIWGWVFSFLLKLFFYCFEEYIEAAAQSPFFHLLLFMQCQNKDLLEIINRQVSKIAQTVPSANSYEGFSKLKLKEKNAKLKSRPNSSYQVNANKRLFSMVTEALLHPNKSLRFCKDLQAKKLTFRSANQSRSWHCGRNTTPVPRTPPLEIEEPPVFFNSFLNQKISQGFKEKQRGLKRICVNMYRRKEVSEKNKQNARDRKGNGESNRAQSTFRYSFSEKGKMFIRQTLR